MRRGHFSPLSYPRVPSLNLMCCGQDKNHQLDTFMGPGFGSNVPTCMSFLTLANCPGHRIREIISKLLGALVGTSTVWV